MEPDILQFFTVQPAALPIYEALEAEIRALFPDARRRVQKTQITFDHRCVFACVSFLRVLNKALLPNPYLVLTLGLPGPLDSARAAVQTEPYPGRWTVHIPLGRPDEVDAELLSWLRASYAFSETKRQAQRKS